MARTLSLVVPSGSLTLGNLLGAIRPWVADQRGAGTMYGIADLHAITTPREPAAVRAQTLEQAALLLAAGLDPARCTVFVQSSVPAHAALLTYPVLQAADVLLYGVDTVPVGDDQRQHLELARDLAIRFNNAYGETFVVPRAVTPQVAARVMNLQDPAAKMDKSAPPEAQGVIRLLDPPDVIRRKISRAVTDSGSRLEPGTGPGPGVANLLTILAAATGTTPQQAAAGVTSYRDLKESCAEAVITRLAPLQDRYAALAADPQTVTKVLRDGSDRARSLAASTLARAKSAIGLLQV